jgi:hypothetical protein
VVLFWRSKASTANDRAHHLQQFADLQRRQIGNVVAVDLARERGGAEARASARWTFARFEVRHHRFLRAFAERLDVAADVRALDAFDDAGVGEVDGALAELRLELAILAVQQQLHFVLPELAELQRIGDRPARRRFAHAREQQAQHAMDVGHRADGGMRSAAEPLLVDDHRHGEVFDRVGGGLRVLGQEVADEQREVLVDLALGLRPNVSNTIDDFPEPDTPVKIVSLRLGIWSVTSLRLFSRAPRMEMNSVMGA